jgi:hyperosmotically inducible periplasmic protein
MVSLQHGSQAARQIPSGFQTTVRDGPVGNLEAPPRLNFRGVSGFERPKAPGHLCGLNAVPNERITMKTLRLFLSSLMLLAVGTLVGCSGTNTQSPDVSESIRNSLAQAGLKDVEVSQDRTKGVVTLAGHVAADADKSQAESIAKSIATGQVVANQIAVLPPGGEKDAKEVNTDLDKGIEHNLDAALLQNKLQDSVKYAVTNGVVTLTGEVNSQSRRSEGEKIASSIPNVKQVVNNLQVKSQKATSSN